jgi:hypothetical protein
MSTLNNLYAVLSDTLAELRDNTVKPDYERIRAINETAGALTAVARTEIDFRKLRQAHGGQFFPALPVEEPPEVTAPNKEAGAPSGPAANGVVTRLTKHGEETITQEGPAAVVRRHVLR